MTGRWVKKRTSGFRGIVVCPFCFRAGTIRGATRRIYNSCRDKRERFGGIDRHQEREKEIEREREREEKRRGFINRFGYLRGASLIRLNGKFEWRIVHLRIATFLVIFLSHRPRQSRQMRKIYLASRVNLASALPARHSKM